MTQKVQNVSSKVQSRIERMLYPNSTDTFVHRIQKWYHTAIARNELPFWIVFSIAIYIPFEEFIIKWLPLSTALRFIPEIILYALTAKVLGQKISKKQGLTPTSIDILLVMFWVTTVISIIVNGSKLIPSLENIRALWRYISVFYIIVNIEISERKLKLLLTSIKTVAVIQAAIAMLQFVMPSSFKQIFAPKQFVIGDIERVSNAEAGNIKAGSVFGTFANPAVLASFLLIMFLIGVSQFLSSPGTIAIQVQKITELIVILFGIFASKKRAALLLAALAPILLLYFRRRIRSVLKLSWIYVALALAVMLLLLFSGYTVDTSFTGQDSHEQTISFTSYIAQLFSPEYYERSSENSRGWMIRTTVGTLFTSGSWFGFGPDQENMREVVFNLLTDGVDRAKIVASEAFFEDVYWVAMLAYYGIVGMVIFSMIMWRLFRAGKWLTKHARSAEYRSLGSIYCTLFILTFFYNCIERVFELRPFSFYFWLMSGLVINAYNQHRFRRPIPTGTRDKHPRLKEAAHPR